MKKTLKKWLALALAAALALPLLFVPMRVQASEVPDASDTEAMEAWLSENLTVKYDTYEIGSQTDRGFGPLSSSNYSHFAEIAYEYGVPDPAPYFSGTLTLDFGDATDMIDEVRVHRIGGIDVIEIDNGIYTLSFDSLVVYVSVQTSDENYIGLVFRTVQQIEIYVDGTMVGVGSPYAIKGPEDIEGVGSIVYTVSGPNYGFLHIDYNNSERLRSQLVETGRGWCFSIGDTLIIDPLFSDSTGYIELVIDGGVPVRQTLTDGKLEFSPNHFRSGIYQLFIVKSVPEEQTTDYGDPISAPEPDPGESIVSDSALEGLNPQDEDSVTTFMEEFLSEWDVDWEEDPTFELDSETGSFLPLELLQAFYAYGEIAENEHAELTFELEVESGITVTLMVDTSKLAGVGTGFDLNFAFTEPDEDFCWDLPGITKYIDVTGTGVVITPPTTGDYPEAFTVTIEITDDVLKGYFGDGYSIEEIEIWHVKSDGSKVLVGSGYTAAPIELTISGASWFIMTDGTVDNERDKPKPKQPSYTPPVTQYSSAAASTYASPVPVAPAKTMYVVDTGFLNERTGPGTQYGRVGVLPRGTLLEIRQISPDGKWALAHTGTWISMQYLRHVSGPATPGAATTASGGSVTKWVVAVSGSSRLNVRSLAGTSGRIVGTLRRGDVVNVTAINGGWATIAYTKEVPVAYVSAQYIRQQ